MALVLLAGCAPRVSPEKPAYPEKSPLTPAEVVDLTRAGLPDDAIIENIEREGVTGGLSPRQAERLRERGVSEAVVDAYRRGRVVVPAEPKVPASRRPLPTYGRLFDPAWYWEEPWGYPAEVD